MVFKFNPFTNNLDIASTSGGGGVVSVAGTANRITSTGGANPVIDIAATYVGQTSLTTLGTITTGTWNGTAVDATHGGTGQTTYATGDILYASAANTLSKLPAGSNTQVLTLAAGVPSWATPVAGLVDSVSGTANRITSTGGTNPVIDIAATYVGQTSLTTLGTVTTGVWNGTTIAVANGGTGATTLTNHGVLIGQGTSAVAATAAGSAGQVLQSGGAAADPAYSTATYPSTATGTGTILRADGTNWAATTATYPNTVTQANFLYGSASNVVSGLAPTTLSGGFPTYDGTNGVWFAPQNYVYEWDDFITAENNTSFSKLAWNRVVAGSGGISMSASAQEAGRPGVVSCNISTTAGSAGGIVLENTASSPLIFGGGRVIANFWVKTPAISDATDTFTLLIGFLSATTGNTGNNALCFSLNSGVNSGNWQMIAVKSGGGTTTASSSTGTDTNWHKYTIDVNAGATSAAFYIDGVQLGNSPITTNIPTTANQPCGPGVTILRTAGSTNARSAYVDLFTLWIALTSGR